MRLFSKIKGVAKNDIEKTCNDLLTKVGLEDVKHA